MKLDDFYDALSTKENMVYREITHDFEVTVRPEYIDEQSAPDQDYYFYAYHVKIKNKGSKPGRLTFRHWLITDGHGNMEEVSGEGVIGECPIIASGETFSYSSFCPLSTPTGNMRGQYTIAREDGEFFINIPLFFLRHPKTFN